MLSVGFSRHRISLGFWGLATISIKYIDNKIKQWNNWVVLVDTKDEEPLNQTWARESHPVGNSRCFINWTWPLHFPPQGCQWWCRACSEPGPPVPVPGSSHPFLKIPWSLLFTLMYAYSWDIQNWDEGPQLVWSLLVYPVIPRPHPTRVATDAHTL